MRLPPNYHHESSLDSSQFILQIQMRKITPNADETSAHIPIDAGNERKMRS